MEPAKWSEFAPMETFTVAVAPRLVKEASVSPGSNVLDIGCGTGVVAITAARAGARATGLDLTAPLLEVAKANAALAGVDVAFTEGDAQALPFSDATFDAVLSQFGHMFAPRADVAAREMLRVLKPGGVVAFATWPPHLFVGRFFSILSRYAQGAPPVWEWGVPEIVAARLGSAVRDVHFTAAEMFVHALSPAHVRATLERAIAPMARAIEGAEPAARESLRREVETLVSAYFQDNALRQGYLITRATKI